MAIKGTLAALATAMALITAGTIYPMTYIVTTVDDEADIVYMHNANGDIFSFSGVSDWEEGDLCSTIMFNNGTSYKVTDDKILTTRYVGTLSMLEREVR